ncbi:metallophosphoesterase [Kaistella anthropi]|nr:metallophosphoesterase [Kaistella anthropi]
MKKFFFALLLSAVAMAYAQKNQLKFNSDGELKILQFTDIHWSNEPKYTNKTTETLRRIIAAEKPDFIVLDGDNVNCIPMRDGWRNLGKIIEEAGVPWTLVFGNHDAEQDSPMHNLLIF